MSRVRVASFAISIDGFGAGPDQSLQNPLGVGGKSLHEWFFKTDTFQTKLGNKTGLRDRDDQWKGWWGTSRLIMSPSSC